MKKEKEKKEERVLAEEDNAMEPVREKDRRKRTRWNIGGGNNY